MHERNSRMHSLHARALSDGYILSQLLITLGICAALIPILTSCLLVLSKSLQVNPSDQDAISIAQLRHIMNVSYDFSIQNDALYFTYHDAACSLSLINRKLIMKPGTVIVLTEVDDISFTEDNGLLILSYERENQSSSYAIARI